MEDRGKDREHHNIAPQLGQRLEPIHNTSVYDPKMKRRIGGCVFCVLWAQFFQLEDSIAYWGQIQGCLTIWNHLWHLKYRGKQVAADKYRA